jgi:hypothetical protein
MSTRSLTVFLDRNAKEFAVMYKHYDGYIDGHGQNLKEFLSGKQIVNGFGECSDRSMIFNGMECLAAGVVAHFKEEGDPGDVYIYKAGTKDVGEEYVYTIFSPNDSNIYIEVEGYEGNILYHGPIEDFDIEEANREEGRLMNEEYDIEEEEVTLPEITLPLSKAIEHTQKSLQALIIKKANQS